MQQNATVLLKFTIPELEPLPHEEQQRILTSCWESDAVQAAWRRYWSRPQQLGFIPILPIAIYGAFANIGFVPVLLVSLPKQCRQAWEKCDRRSMHCPRRLGTLPRGGWT